MEAVAGWPAGRRTPTNGVELSVHCAGPEASALPPVVLCHGFPEIAFSWRHQLRDLAAAGVRVLAPDQRGYGGSDAPEPVEAYDIAALTGDLVGLLDAFGVERAVFVGHDWGGLVTWALGARHPDRVAGLVGLNTPFTRRAPQDPIDLYRRKFGDDFYIVRFQEPGAAEAVLEADLRRTFRGLMRRHTAPLVSGGILAPPDPPEPDPHALLSEAELAVYVAAFTRSGFRGPINWYRNFSRNWRLSEGLADHVAAPSLMIMAADDPVLPPSAADGMEKYVPNLSRALIRDCGHWSQQERPAEVTAAILDWLGATFPGAGGRT